MSGPPRTPLLTVDAIVVRKGAVLMIRRKNPPPGWALPGGFVDVGESVERAACRELEEETGLRARRLRLLGCYSDPRRDPRGHTVALVYVIEASGEPCAADDADDVAFHPLERMPRPIAFDHRKILKDFLAERRPRPFQTAPRLPRI